MKYYERLDKLPELPTIGNSVEEILRSNNIDMMKHNQICINTVVGRETDYLFGAGSLQKDWHNRYTKSSGEIVIPDKTVNYTERDFSIVCDQFKGTLLEHLYKIISFRFVVGRVRLMCIPPKTVMSWHKDTSKRLHIPIRTYDGCFMIIEDELIHMNEGEWWIADTTQNHTALNSSMSPRIHLVASILDGRRS